ncbi:hypothetical protein K438DRAFT_1979524 [Mycena galopus ATCC 62051]|nr:hypothetical protein K438DRAFT_1979524 [Mycena galopus ATCC 62051]
MHMRNLSLFTLLAVLSGVQGQAEQWLCECTTGGQYNEQLTEQCCAQSGGILVPPPPPQCQLVGNPVAGPALNFINCCAELGGGFECTPLNKASAGN